MGFLLISLFLRGKGLNNITNSFLFHVEINIKHLSPIIVELAKGIFDRYPLFPIENRVGKGRTQGPVRWE